MQSREPSINSPLEITIFDRIKENKVVILFGLLTIAILTGGVWFLSAQGAKEEEKLAKPLMGEEVNISSASHVEEGTAENQAEPPAGGPMYGQTAGPGIKEEQAQAGALNHSLEHGAAVVFYREDISEPDRKRIEESFLSAEGSKIMTPWKGLDSPVVLTSWGRRLKLKTIDPNTIQQFIETNNNRAPESGMI